MHVLVVPSWYPTTQAPLDGIYFAEQAQCLQEAGLQVGVVYPEQQTLRRLSGEALRTKYFQTEWTKDFGIPTLRRYGWNVWWRFPPGMRVRVWTAVRLAHQYVARHGVPDVIHAHSARWAGAAAARIGDAFSTPSVLTEHYSGFVRGDVFPWRWSLVEEGFRQADAISVVSEALKDALVQQGLAGSSDALVQPNLVRTPFFTRPSRVRDTPPPFRLVTVARLEPRKNVGGLLDAFARGFGGTQDASLTIVGDGPERDALEEEARQRGVADRVSFPGMADREGVREALWNAHGFVLSSLHETFGVVLAEAMATGLPVVATRCGGPEDIVSEETGLLVPVDDPRALADGLVALRDRWSTFDSAEIREYAVERYGPEPFIRRTRSLYRQAGVGAA